MYGYGNSMFLATHGILARTASGGGVDPDAQAFITAASITNPTQQSAINQLVVDLKGYNIWTKMKALYPFVGGTSSTHKFNLKNPLDTDAAFRIVWSGGVTHSANGVQFGGVNGYGDTKLNLSSNLTQNNTHLSFYSRTNTTTPTNQLEMGAQNTGFSTYLGYSYSGGYSGINSAETIRSSVSTPTTGMLIGSRIAQLQEKYYFNNVSQTLSKNSNGVPNSVVFIGASRHNGSPALYSSKQCAFASIGDGLTDTEAANLYTAVQTFQTTLGRSIGTQTVSDADAQAFVTNAGIVDQVEANAVNNLVIGLKADGLWSKMKALYPMVGGSSSTMKYNLKNPLDTDAAFRLVFSGGWTFSQTGALPNGTNAFADTFFNQTANFTSTSNASIGVYLRTNNPSTGADMGAGDTGSARQGMLIFSSFGGTYYGCAMGDTFIGPAPTNNDSRGFYSVVRNAGVQSLHKRGNITLNVSETEAVGSVTNETIWVGGGTSGGYNFSSRETAFNFIGDALSQTEIDNLYTRVQTFQTALNRNV